MQNNIPENFYQRWKNKGDELSDTQTFWLEILQELCGVENPGEFIEFQKRVELSHVSFIDAYIPETGIIIEQKSRDVNLNLSAKQSDGNSLTPFEQAKRYYDWLPISQKGKYIIVCNFRELRIHDMEFPKAPPRIIKLEELEREKDNLAFLITPDKHFTYELRVSLRAGELAGMLYDALAVLYRDMNNPRYQYSLNVLCVRIVFLLYSEDAGVFAKSQFHDFVEAHSQNLRQSLIDLFRVLNQPEGKRDFYTEDDVKAFPFVGGGLFEEENIEVPIIKGEALRIILEDMSEGFDWSEISPTIFGAVFESTLNPETRHGGGMHYTAPENIHKAIDLLFMDDLSAELDKILTIPPSTNRTRKLRAFQKKLASLKFFDPACGSGNFLTETFLSLRKLENKIIEELTNGQVTFAFSFDETPIQISISQFYGLEVNDFAIAVSRTALWIAECQMMNETQKIVYLYDHILPLKKFNNIIKANALRTDWLEVVHDRENLFIIGNPPFMGYWGQTPEQKSDIRDIYKGYHNKAGKIDYVAGWYYKAAEFIKGSEAKVAFVSTSSICQGEQTAYVWKPLLDDIGIHIDFAYQPFKWESESFYKVNVYVVIIGFNMIDDDKLRRLYTPSGLKLVENINAYLMAGDNVYAEARAEPLKEDTPRARVGCIPIDNGNLLMSPSEYEDLLKTDPLSVNFTRPFMMGKDFIDRKVRYCLWLEDVNPDDIKKSPRVLSRIKNVREYRLSSTRTATRKMADIPTLFAERRICEIKYIAIPAVSSSERKYIPMDWLPPEVIPGNKLFMIENATFYHFGVLTSRVHMAWVRRVAGRLGNGFNYSNTVVYNTFAWPDSTDRQRAKIERTAQKILDVRAKYPDSSFASLYDDMLMPADLRRVHRENDEAVCEAYGWDKDISEEELIARLFVLYGEAVKGE